MLLLKNPKKNLSVGLSLFFKGIIKESASTSMILERNQPGMSKFDAYIGIPVKHKATEAHKE
jgi:hypothetical protein